MCMRISEYGSCTEAYVTLGIFSSEIPDGKQRNTMIVKKKSNDPLGRKEIFSSRSFQ